MRIKPFHALISVQNPSSFWRIVLADCRVMTKIERMRRRGRRYGKFKQETTMRTTLRWLCAGTLTLGAVAMIGCEKPKSENTTTTSTGAPTTMDSAKQSAENAADKAADKSKEMGAEMKSATSQAVEKTKEGAEAAKEKTTQAIDNLKK